jgi:WXG100 family type VII secretion target
MTDDLSDGYIHVNYSHMNNASDDLVQQTKAIATTVSNLEMEISQLKREWIGGDAEEYNHKQQTWDAAVKKMENLLTTHAQLLDEITGSYKYTENNLAQLWSGVRIGG